MKTLPCVESLTRDIPRTDEQIRRLDEISGPLARNDYSDAPEDIKINCRKISINEHYEILGMTDGEAKAKYRLNRIPIKKLRQRVIAALDYWEPDWREARQAGEGK